MDSTTKERVVTARVCAFHVCIYSTSAYIYSCIYIFIYSKSFGEMQREEKTRRRCNHKQQQRNNHKQQQRKNHKQQQQKGKHQRRKATQDKMEDPNEAMERTGRLLERADDTDVRLARNGKNNYARVTLDDDALNRLTLDDLRELAMEMVHETTLMRAMGSLERKRSFIRALLKSLELNKIFKASYRQISDVVEQITAEADDPRNALEDSHIGGGYYNLFLIREKTDGMFECDNADNPRATEFGICQGCHYQAALEAPCPGCTNVERPVPLYHACHTEGPKKEFWALGDDKESFDEFSKLTRRIPPQGLPSEILNNVGKYLFYEGDVDLSCGAYNTGYKLQLEASCYTNRRQSVVHDITEFFRRYQHNRDDDVGSYISMYQDMHESTTIPGTVTVEVVDKWRAEHEHPNQIDDTITRDLDRARDDFIYYLVVLTRDSDDDDEFIWGGSVSESEEDFTEE